MDALDILRSDHQRIIALFGEFGSSRGDPRRQKETLERIRSELLDHARVEETVFYPAFKNYPSFQEILSASYQDHRDIRDRLKKDDLGDLESIMSLFREHIEKEENEMFAMVRKLMKRNERETLGRHLQAAKQEPTQAA